MISPAWPRPFWPLMVRVRTLNVPAVNSLSRAFNLAALRNARLSCRVYRPLLVLFRVAFNRLTFRLLRFLPCFQSVVCSTPDPRHPPPSCPVGCLLQWDLLSFLLSILQSPRFPRRSPIVTAGRKARGEPNPRLLRRNPRQQDHAIAPRARQYTDEISAPHTPGTRTRHEVPGSGTLLWSDGEDQGGGGRFAYDLPVP